MRLKQLSLLLVVLLYTSICSAQELILYKEIDTVKLFLEVHYPPKFDNSKTYPAMVFFHGGGWRSGNRQHFINQAKHFAERGIVCFLPDYRIENIHGTTPFESLKDAKSAMRYIRKNALNFSIDPTKIIASGGSAGGHLAAAAALIGGYNEDTDDLSVSPIPNALVLFNPVIDNGSGGYGYERIGDQYVDFSPLHNIKPGAPPTIFFLGTKDKLIPVATGESYRDKMQQVGSVCELKLYEGQGHGFFGFNNYYYYRDTLREADKFLQSLGYLEKIPAPISHNETPSQIKGVKWKQHSDDNFIENPIKWWLRKPSGSSKLDVMTAIETKANAMVIRVDPSSRFEYPQDTNFDKAMSEIVDAIKQAKKDNNLNLDVYLWARIWMERDGEPNFGSIDAGAYAVLERFTPILTKSMQEGVFDNIKGIVLVETNIDNMDDVKEYAKRTVDIFNQESFLNDFNGEQFFKTRTFITPGVGFGMDYRNVDNDSGIFLKEMSEQCENFAFLYKFMRATHESVTVGDYDNVDINGTPRSWETDMEKNEYSFNVADRQAYLNYFGATELVDYVNAYKNTYPNATNIVFWGDKWDGISKIPPLSRVALHQILLLDGNQKGYFFNMAVSNVDNEAANRFYLFDKNYDPNQIKSWSGVTTEEDWDGWPKDDTNYR